ncbi:hypothetical protein [Paenibacillus glucanolyticus]|jgi:hypothetical protein|uniref:hypothetical protein n=1 Tax=Paenibacillus glucanolyticus TaxID=59843 RepID=UPI00128E22BF|nr:hypothetical protein [Paenibacillus glucanolyticus]MPY20261.1 hypothetical protein [Paenibacillus glucanolyticus]
MARAHSAYTVDLSQQNTESKVLPATTYNPAALEIRGSFGSVQIVASDEQLAEIEYAIQQHFENKKISDSPKQTIKDVELDYSIKEGIA